MTDYRLKVVIKLSMMTRPDDMKLRRREKTDFDKQRAFGQ